MKRFFTTISLFFILIDLSAQHFGGTPPGVKWQQIVTDTARIIFPTGLDSTALRIATNIHHMASLNAVSLGNSLKRINIVLQNHTVIPNGYVALGPYRSEFYLTPLTNNFDMGNIPWIDQLSVHEYRHVQQYNNFKKGGSKLMYYLFGQDGLSLATNAAIPDWFFEGDAVYMETLLTHQGRGRLPYFMNEFPALWSHNINYKWMKLRNGSYKDYVPNHYTLGYLLVNYGYQKYGSDFWKKITTDAASYKSLIYPFQNSIKRHARVNYKTFVQNAFTYYKSELTQAGLVKKGEAIQKKNKTVTDETSPVILDDGSIILQKSSFNKTPAFYIRREGKDYFIKKRDISIDDQFNYRNGKIIYTAYEKNSRWDWQDYSTIKIVDTKTGNKLNLTKKSKYFMPDISPKGDEVAAVENNEAGQSSIVILNAVTGVVQKKIDAQAIAGFSNPRYINNDSLATVVKFSDGKSALALVEISTGIISRITIPSYNVVGNPYCKGDSIFFTASYGGNNGLYVTLLSKPSSIYLIQSANEGLYTPTANNSTIVASTFTPFGYKNVSFSLPNRKQKPLSEVETDQSSNSYSKLIAGNQQMSFLNQNIRAFDIKKYPGATKLINIHSWRPNYEDPEFTFTFYGNNILNTTLTNLYYLYNRNTRAHAVGFDVAFSKWFPYLYANTEYSFNNSSYNSQIKNYRYWNQLDNSVGLSIPLSWIKNTSYRYLNLSTFFHTRNDYNTGVTKNLFKPIQFTYLSHAFSYAQYMQQAYQHINPRFGYRISINNRHATTSFRSWQWLTQGALYLPGLFPNHSLVLNAGWQSRDTTSALFSNNISYARGFQSAYYPRMTSFKANYHMPICYPDAGAFNIVYVMRLRTNLFFDRTWLHSLRTGNTYAQQSTGIELYADTKWWNQYPLTLGFRVSRLLTNDMVTGNKGFIFEWVLPVSIIPN